ncbi:MAG: biotin/lipoyl-binding protein [Planctomycetota bacterium]
MILSVLFLAPVALHAASGDDMPTSGDAPATTEKALFVEVAPIEWVKGYRRTRRYTGRIEARRTADLGFERAARIQSVSVDDGDAVDAGDVLATLDVRDLKLDRAEVEARRAGALAKLDELESGPRAQTITAAREVVKGLKAQLALGRLKVARRRELLVQNAISKEELDEEQFGTAAIEARLGRARAILDELVEGTRKERIAAQRALVRNLDAQLGAIDLDLDKSVLRAPFAGRIAGRLADEGHVVAPREAILRVVETAALEARVGLPAGETLAAGSIHSVRIGDRVYQARVRAGLPEVDRASRTRLFVLDLIPDHATGAADIVPGQIAQLAIARRVETEGFWLPSSALVKSTRGLWAVYVVRNDRVERRDIDVLHIGDDNVLARGPLEKGEAVILGTHRVVAGQRVRIQEG